ncbi:MAG: hypothetical protein AVO33_00790 [delta proteobacterium ML8_F1]|nr:MAG: hypothetical protein AVO33_00790 [delta proteobacterium ML8_F1]
MKAGVLYYQGSIYLCIAIAINRFDLKKALKPALPYERHFVYNQLVLRYNITGYRIVGLVEDEILVEDELKNQMVLEIPVK